MVQQQINITPLRAVGRRWPRTRAWHLAPVSLKDCTRVTSRHLLIRLTIPGCQLKRLLADPASSFIRGRLV